jgi:hypothetical protein
MEVVSTTTTTDPVNMYDYLNKFVLNPMVFVIILLIIITYYVFSSSLGLGNSSFSVSSSEPSFISSSVITTIIIVILVLLILVNAFQYFFSINLTAYIKGLFTPETQVDIVLENTTKTGTTGTTETTEITTTTEEKVGPDFSKLRLKKQVFNIPGNYYSYENAKALCKAYDADLATYDQIEKAYNNGAEWCNYGWSANQMALFPTQKQTYNTLQTIKGHENDCGRPGVNGGYIANPRIRFGVNCYGYKPSITEKEEELMKTSTPYPETREDKIFQKKVDFWKDKIDQILVSPFNYNIWGQV